MNRTTLAAALFMVFGGYLLWAEHSAHLALAIPYLPWLILIACPLLHVFMHGGHRHGGHGADEVDDPPARQNEGSTKDSAYGGRHG